MNVLILLPEDFINHNKAVIIDRRFQHLVNVQRVRTGEIIKIGLINDRLGLGTVTAIKENAIEIDVSLSTTSPTALPLTLVLALPRPKMLRRILQTCATMGVKDIVLINSYRVEKSYWQTPLLSENAVKEQLILGLEQGKDTILPSVKFEKRFKPFVEDKLPSLIQHSKALIAHPGSPYPCPKTPEQHTLLVIGPEGGFIPYEVEKLVAAGCKPIHLGERILRVETAIPALLTQLFF